MRVPGAKHATIATLLTAVSVVFTTGSVAADDSKFDMSGFADGLGPPVTYTPQQQAIIAQKEALAAQELRAPGTVYHMSHPAGRSITYVYANGTRVASDAMTPMVADPDGATLGTWTRQQTKSYYCGPTAVQVVGDFVWWTGPNTVHNTQQYISDTWTKTDATRSTMVNNEVRGLNGNAGSRMPAGFIYASAREANTVAGGAAWHAKLREDIGGFGMPGVASVSPKQNGAPYQLPSWQGPGTAPAGNYGHYIVFNTYIGKWDGASPSPWIGYDDGSGGYGGGTGSYSASAKAIYWMMWDGNPNHTPGYFIW
jgi:hypothetical protein